jgi:hypothetical protein
MIVGYGATGCPAQTSDVAEGTASSAEPPPGAAAAEASSDAAYFAEQVRPFFATFCTDCHGGDEPEGDLRLDQFSAAPDVLADLEHWTVMHELVAGHQMPPEDATQPDELQRRRFLQWLHGELQKFDCGAQPTRPGKITIHRLNRTEYNNTVRDLLGVDWQPAADFPADDVGEGFDNMADVLSLPPLLMEKYLEAAETITAKLFAEPALRRQILFIMPDAVVSAEACSRQLLETLASRAFRRPLRAGEIERLTDLARLARERGMTFEQGIEFATQAILISPHFLFRAEVDDPALDKAERPLTSFELASRLSYFLWSSMPDAELFRVAGEGRLNEPDVLAEQTRRMLADPKAAALVDNFAAQWLELRQLERAAPDPERYPSFDPTLRSAMREETRSFLRNIVQQDRSVLELLDSDYTYMNERLARHYGVENVSGEEFRRVNLPDRRRGGILTHASILTLTSNPTRTSPVKRGKWILENILGTPPPPPPPNVPELKEGDLELLGTLRERMQQHRENPSCAVCHRKMDALGFGFENFDGIGAWREQDGRHEIDAAGELPGKITFNGPAELRRILIDSSEDFTRCLSRKMLTYALGRGLESFDRCTVDGIVAQVQASDHRFSSLVLAIVSSEPFQMREARGDQGNE